MITIGLLGDRYEGVHTERGAVDIVLNTHSDGTVDAGQQATIYVTTDARKQTECVVDAAQQATVIKNQYPSAVSSCKRPGNQ